MKNFEINTRVIVKGKEGKKFLPNEILYIHSDKVKIEKGKKEVKFREVRNVGGVVQWVKQKYIHQDKGPEL